MAIEAAKADWAQKLQAAGVRPTRQRRLLARLLFESGKNRHVTAETLYAEVQAAGGRLSMATVYNTLHHFAEKGLLNPLKVAPDRIWYDTRIDPHHHFYYVDDGQLEDIGPQDVSFAALPQAPQGTDIETVEVVIKLTRRV